MNTQQTFSLATLIAYVKLLLSNRMVSAHSSGKVRLFGKLFDYGNRGSLHGMFKEIFLDQNYYIDETNIPITILDCGSNMGMSLLYFRRKAPNAHIQAFEPNPHTFAYLSRNEKNYGLNATLHNVGLASHKGTAVLYTDTKDLSSQSASLTKHLEVKKRDLQQIEIQLVPLSTYITSDVDILKLDIEGAEGEVLEELQREGKLPFIKKIFIEYHYDGVNTVYPFGKMLSILEASGYKYVVGSGIKFPFIITGALKNYSYKIVAWR